MAATAPSTTNPIPFIAGAHIRAFFSRTEGAVVGLAITYLDDRGACVGSAIAGLAEVEQHARALLSTVAAARAADPAVVPIGLMPRADTILMRPAQIGGAA